MWLKLNRFTATLAGVCALSCSAEYIAHKSFPSPNGSTILDVSTELQGANDPDPFWQHVSLRSASVEGPVVPGNVAVFSAGGELMVTWKSDAKVEIVVPQRLLGTSLELPEPTLVNGVAVTFELGALR
jgi:hypothetical protein